MVAGWFDAVEAPPAEEALVHFTELPDYLTKRVRVLLNNPRPPLAGRAGLLRVNLARFVELTATCKGHAELGPGESIIALCHRRMPGDEPTPNTILRLSRRRFGSDRFQKSS
jgi:hypothetical protein